MKFCKLLYEKIIRRACVCSVLINALLLAVASAGASLPALTVFNFTAVFLFSLALSLASLVLDIKALNSVMKYFIHLVMCAAAYFVFLKATLDYSEAHKTMQLGVDKKQYIVGFIIFLIVYAVCVGFKFAAAALVRLAEKKKQKPYENMFE